MTDAVTVKAVTPVSAVADDLYTNAVGLGCALDAFQEAKQVQQWIDDLSHAAIARELPAKWEWTFQHFTIVLDYYQEQPHLLDPHLPHFLTQLLALMRATADKPVILHAAAAFTGHLVKVRQAKVAVRHFPHEVADVEPVLALLTQELAADEPHWETVNVLLLWMSMLILIPFDMSRFDSGQREHTLKRRIYRVMQRCLLVANRAQDGAAMLAAKFLTRPEIVGELLPEFFDWAVQTTQDEKASNMAKMGALKALAAVYKQGKRQDLLDFTPRMLKDLLALNLKTNFSVWLRKLNLKVIQRFGLIFLKARVASWRYQRGNRSLAFNLQTDPDGVLSGQKENLDLNPDDGGDDEYDIPDEIEDVIEELLSGLRDVDTVIRWSAAKGIGRITNRLPQELADDVVGSLLKLFSLREYDGAWHGGCLALAELGRRGLLLPQRLKEVVRVVLKALVYDEKKGSYSVGSHIRDAACYVCWAFARAFDPEILRPYVDQIACALLTVTIFDREVNCRRAASAAFQENVGRQGTFPHGIEILTQADYFAVGSRNNTYLELSVFVAKLGDYLPALVNHLVEKKINHWDSSIRELTAESLHNLTPINPELMKNEVLPKLLIETKGLDLFAKHGSIVAIGSICLALSKDAQSRGQTLQDIVDPETISQIKSVASALVEKLSLRMTGGDMLRQAVTSFISNCSKARFPIHQDQTVELWHAILTENLSNSDPIVQDQACEAVPNFLSEYLKDVDTGELLTDKRDAILDEYLNELDSSELHRRGFATALGSFPEFALRGRVGDVLKKLIKCTEITPNTDKWAEGRRDSILALTSVAKRVGFAKDTDGDKLVPSTVVRLYQCLLGGFNDYTLDRRGDVGAWVREAAMASLCSITLTLVDLDPQLVPEICIRDLMPCLAQQAMEKIDRTRGLATKLFASLLFHEKRVPGIPRAKEVKALFPENLDMNTFQWTVESETFPVFTKLIHFDEYLERVLVGLVVSVGGLTERLVKHSSASLFKELETMDKSALDRFAQATLNVLRDNHKVDRVTIPALKFLDQLFSTSHFESILEDETHKFSFELLTLVKNEISKSGDPQKLMLSCDVICALLQSHDELTVKKSLVQLAIFLCHKFPRIRKVTANKLFEALLTFADRTIVPEENLDEVNTLLSDTDWDQSIENIRPIRNQLCDLMGVPAPAIIKKVI